MSGGARARVGVLADDVLVVDFGFPPNPYRCSRRPACFGVTSDRWVLGPGAVEAIRISFVPSAPGVFRGAAVFEHDFGVATVDLKVS